MADLYLQALVLYYLYESYNKDKDWIVEQKLCEKKYLRDVKPGGRELENELDFLKGKGYVESTQQQQWKISAIGIEKTESLCNNFVEYIKTHNVEDSSYWVNYFNVFTSTHERFDEIFFKIHEETILQDAFKKYLNTVNSI